MSQTKTQLVEGFNINPSAPADALVIDSSGRLLIGTTTEGDANADDVTIASSGNTGITIRSGTTNRGNIYFSDGTSGDAEYRGFIEYNHDGDRLSLGTANATRIRIDSSGNVGIGTTSPLTPLHVRSGSSGASSSTSNSYLTVESNGSSAIQLLSGNAYNNFIYFGDNDDTDVAYIQYSHGANAMIFHANAAERARIDSSGRLLVGTASSRTNVQFQVEGTSYASSSASLIRNTNDGGGPTFILGKSRGTTDTSFTVVQNDDYLGSIEFSGADGSSDRAAAQINCFVDGTPGSADMPGRLVFSTTADGASSPTERMRIDNKGSLCLWQPGNTTNAPQDLNGRIFAYNDGTSSSLYIDSRKSTAFIHVNQTYGDTGNRSAIAFYRSEAAKGSISIDSSQTYFNTTSDYRLKENILPLSGATDRIKQLKPSQFNFIIEPDKTVDGFIAHEVQDVVPECVIGTKDEVDENGDPVYQGIDQSKLVPLLTAALQEALAEIESLKARVTALEP